MATFRELLREDEKKLNIINQKVFCRFVNKELLQIGNNAEKYPKNEYLLRVKEALLKDPDNNFVNSSVEQLLEVLQNKFQIEEDEDDMNSLIKDMVRKVFHTLSQDENLKLLDKNTTAHKREVNKTKMGELVYNVIGEYLRKSYLVEEAEDEVEEEDSDNQEDEGEDTEIDFNSGIDDSDSQEEDPEEDREDPEDPEEVPKENPEPEVLTIGDKEEEKEEKNNEFVFQDGGSSNNNKFTEEEIKQFREFQKFLKLQEQAGAPIEFEEYLKSVLESIKPKRATRRAPPKPKKEDSEPDEPPIPLFDAPMRRRR